MCPVNCQNKGKINKNSWGWWSNCLHPHPPPLRSSHTYAEFITDTHSALSRGEVEAKASHTTLACFVSELDCSCSGSRLLGHLNSGHRVLNLGLHLCVHVQSFSIQRFLNCKCELKTHKSSTTSQPWRHKLVSFCFLTCVFWGHSRRREAFSKNRIGCSSYSCTGLWTSPTPQPPCRARCLADLVLG